MNTDRNLAPEIINQPWAREFFARKGGVLDGTPEDLFFKDLDKVVNQLRFVRELRQSERGVYVDYQDTVYTDLVSKLLTRGWRVVDIAGDEVTLADQDQRRILITKEFGPDNMVLARVTILFA